MKLLRSLVVAALFGGALVLPATADDAPQFLGGIIQQNECKTDSDCGAPNPAMCTKMVCVKGCCETIAMTAGTVCRPAVGPCDVAEVCDGSTQRCPDDRFAGTETVCRPSAGPCDVPEMCTGKSTDCPPDSFAGTETVCRPSAGPCDVPDSCDGKSKDCPKDEVAGCKTLCRPAAGICDVPESCDGVSPVCPPDLVAPITQVCRPSTGKCDRVETCDGVHKDCPPDSGPFQQQCQDQTQQQNNMSVKQK